MVKGSTSFSFPWAENCTDTHPDCGSGSAPCVPNSAYLPGKFGCVVGTAASLKDLRGSHPRRSLKTGRDTETQNYSLEAKAEAASLFLEGRAHEGGGGPTPSKTGRQNGHLEIRHSQPVPGDFGRGCGDRSSGRGGQCPGEVQAPAPPVRTQLSSSD